jgi:hypothetical protein
LRESGYEQRTPDPSGSAGRPKDGSKRGWIKTTRTQRSPKKADTEYRKTEKENKYQLHMLLDRRVKDELKMIEWLDQQKAEGRKITDLIKELLLKEAKRKPKNT